MLGQQAKSEMWHMATQVIQHGARRKDILQILVFFLFLFLKNSSNSIVMSLSSVSKCTPVGHLSTLPGQQSSHLLAVGYIPPPLPFC